MPPFGWARALPVQAARQTCPRLGPPVDIPSPLPRAACFFLFCLSAFRFSFNFVSNVLTTRHLPHPALFFIFFLASRRHTRPALRSATVLSQQHIHKKRTKPCMPALALLVTLHVLCPPPPPPPHCCLHWHTLTGDAQRTPEQARRKQGQSMSVTVEGTMGRQQSPRPGEETQ